MHGFGNCEINAMGQAGMSAQDYYERQRIAQMQGYANHQSQAYQPAPQPTPDNTDTKLLFLLEGD